MRIQRPWYTVPVILLSLGVMLSGYVFWRILNRKPPLPQQTTNSTNTVQAPVCGDGVCQNVACLSTGCPAPESPDTCPQDCANEPSSPGTDVGEPNGNDNGNSNTNANTNSSADLSFTLTTQSLQDKKVCPIEEANLTPSDAVRIAHDAGLEQGSGTVDVRLYKYAPPLDQCVWSVKNSETKTSGREFTVIDLTQEVFRKTSWQSSS